MLANRPRERTTARRRGVTLIEMLVTVAVLVIMMTILVQIFQAATGSVSQARTRQELDDQLRRIDGIIRGDLEGATAHFTPPLDPEDNLGYFEYSENEFADIQGEDGDDYIRFTAKAPPGRPFTGRFWPKFWTNTTTGQTFQYVSGVNSGNFPITITSDYAEVIYFLRNGNLYRRVFLIVPDLQAAVDQNVSTTANGKTTYGGATYFSPSFQPQVFNSQSVSWQGVNDVSAHPSPTGPPSYNTNIGSIVLNTLGDLTNRENRMFNVRFSNDFVDVNFGSKTDNSVNFDGIPDDINGDTIPDLYPTLYPQVFSPKNSSGHLLFPTSSNATMTGVQQLASNPGAPFLGFPFIFPGAYSRAQALQSDAYGWIHAPSSYAYDAAGNSHQFDTDTINYLENLNHNPLEYGDNLPVPPAYAAYQTWWGFPTWRETLSPAWNDPYWQVNVALQAGANQAMPNGLTYAHLNLGSASGNQGQVFAAPPGQNFNVLPPMSDPSNYTGNFSIFRPVPQLFCDGAGQNSIFFAENATFGAGNAALWALSWEDDLILTNVRSFDVKAYDPTLGHFADLGWGDDLRLYAQYANLPGAYATPTSQPAFLQGTPKPTLATFPYFPWPYARQNVNPAVTLYNPLQTLAHEGRMPPLTTDLRFDAQYGQATYPSYPNYPGGNIGDDNPSIVRLRRVWDSWSTDYSRAPSRGTSPLDGGFPFGPPFSPPIYPSYPAPYPAPLRGIQIQIRVADPGNQYVKQITIRQDFTDKL